MNTKVSLQINWPNFCTSVRERPVPSVSSTKFQQQSQKLLQCLTFAFTTATAKAGAKIASIQGTDTEPEWVVWWIPTTLQNT